MIDWGYFVSRLNQVAGGFSLAGVLDELEAAIQYEDGSQRAAMPCVVIANALGSAALRTNDPIAISRCLIIARDLDEMVAREYAGRVLPVVVGGIKSHASSLVTVLNTLNVRGTSLSMDKNLKLAESRLARENIKIPW